MFGYSMVCKLEAENNTNNNNSKNCGNYGCLWRKYTYMYVRVWRRYGKDVRVLQGIESKIIIIIIIIIMGLVGGLESNKKIESSWWNYG